MLNVRFFGYTNVISGVVKKIAFVEFLLQCSRDRTWLILATLIETMAHKYLYLQKQIIYDAH